MPELRVLTEQLVKSSIERSIAPLLDRQRELEVKVERSGGVSFDTSRESQAQIEAAIAPLLAKQRAFETMLEAFRRAELRPESLAGGGAGAVPKVSTSSERTRDEQQQPAAPRVGPPPLPTQAPAQRVMTVEHLAMRARTDALAAAALSANGLVDIPAELNGSRRKRVVVLLLLLTVIGILATVASLSVMSNLGAYP